MAFETESQNPDQAPELARYLTEALQPRLEAAGFVCTIFPNPDPHAGPFLVAERIADRRLPPKQARAAATFPKAGKSIG